MAVAPAAARPRPGGGRLFIIVGVLLAIVAFGAVFLISSATGGAGLGGPTTSVVIAKQAIPLRHQITSADIELAKVSINGNGSLANTYPATTDVLSLVSEINITKGSVITSDMLARDISLVPAGAAPAYLPLAKGYVAITIPTGEQQGVAGHITLGDYIAVIASANISVFAVGAPPSGPTKIISKTVFTNVRIIGLGPAVANVQPAAGTGNVGGSTGPSSGVVSSLTIEMTQCDAEYFTWFLNNTTLKYTLESFHDYLTQPPSTPDPNCKNVDAAQGVSQKAVENRYHFTTL